MDYIIASLGFAWGFVQNIDNEIFNSPLTLLLENAWYGLLYSIAASFLRDLFPNMSIIIIVVLTIAIFRKLKERNLL